MVAMRPSVVGASVLAAGLVLGASLPARAGESLIRTPGDHPSYRFEAEPHGLLGYGGPAARGAGAFGVGFRGTVIIVENGFIKTINNSVGIGFGGDFLVPQGTFFIPIVMQWNFWLTSRWSVFGEPGLGFAANPPANRDVLHVAAYAGGRFHFNDRVALTLRLGYPTLSVGVSFFL
jgi:hypothetical protein